MGLHSSPTGELFLQDVRAGRDRLLGESEERAAASGRAGAKETFSMERSGVAAMALGIIERCLELAVKYASERVQFGRPIGEFQLVQEKLARMEVARLNVQNLVFRVIEGAAEGKALSFSEASAMKLYSARDPDRRDRQGPARAVARRAAAARRFAALRAGFARLPCAPRSAPRLGLRSPSARCAPRSARLAQGRRAARRAAPASSTARFPCSMKSAKEKKPWITPS
jgi:alkylation response protein AidB-like acyl-CoA dehydrogenase